MPLVAVLDASVLYPMPLCDLLLRLAERAMFEPRWGEEILNEVRRTLAERLGYDAAIKRLAAMVREFPEARVPASPEEEDKLALPDPDDRHVVAAAVVSGAPLIITHNLRDFPTSRLPRGLLAEHPDTFLLTLLTEDPSTVIGCIGEQARGTGVGGRPKLTVPDVLRSLELAGVPRFAAAVRELLTGS